MSKHAYLNYHLEYTQTHSTTLVKVPLSISKDHAAPSTVTFLVGVPPSTAAMQTSVAAAIHSGFKVALFSTLYMKSWPGNKAMYPCNCLSTDNANQ